MHPLNKRQTNLKRESRMGYWQHWTKSTEGENKQSTNNTEHFNDEQHGPHLKSRANQGSNT